MGEVVWINQKTREDMTMGTAIRKERRRDEITPRTRHVIGRNVGLLWDRNNWTQKESKGRTIDRYRSGESNPTISKLEFVAERAGIPVWYLLVPDMDENAISGHDVENLVNAFLSKPDKRKTILDLVSALTK